MKFAATLVGVTPKDTSDGLRIEIRLIAQFDAGLFAQLGDCFSERVSAEINQAQRRLELEEGQGEAGRR
jgi:hypothetical protein